MALTQPSDKMLAPGSSLTLTTMQATTSGTTKDFTDIPAGTKEIVIMLSGVSHNGTSTLTLLLGTTGGLDSTADYRTRLLYALNATAPSISTSDATVFLLAVVGNADNVTNGQYTLTLMDASTNLWSLSGSACNSGTSPYFSVGCGTKALSGALTQLRFSSNSANTFDAGNISIAYK